MGAQLREEWQFWFPEPLTADINRHTSPNIFNLNIRFLPREALPILPEFLQSGKK
jgi:hypothetical protein